MPTYDWLAEAGIVPTNLKTYSLSEIQSALNDKFGANVFIKCDYNHAINEIWYYHHVKGSLLQHNFLPIDSVAHTNCPSTGIKYPPKGKVAHPTLTTKTTTGTSTTIHNPMGIPARSYVHLSGNLGVLLAMVNGTLQELVPPIISEKQSMTQILKLDLLKEFVVSMAMRNLLVVVPSVVAQISKSKMGKSDIKINLIGVLEAPLDLVQQLKLVLNWQTDLVILSNC